MNKILMKHWGRTWHGEFGSMVARSHSFDYGLTGPMERYQQPLIAMFGNSMTTPPYKSVFYLINLEDSSIHDLVRNGKAKPSGFYFQLNIASPPCP